jgi:hypothetical protein
MARRRRWRAGVWHGGAAIVFAACVSWTAVARAQPAGSPASPDEDCLVCHAEPSLTGRGGRAVAVDLATFAQSVHGRAGLGCTDCHADLQGPRELPHQTPLAPVRCEICHEDAGAAYARSIHARARQRAAESPAPTCADCHGTHDIRAAQDPAARTFPLTLPATCGRCHGDPEIIRRGRIEIGDVFSLYRDSVHGRALSEAGLIVAANCRHCHGSHDIRRKTDPSSPVHRANIAATCGACHVGIAAQYRRGIHGRAARPEVPVCSDCHTAHRIERVDAPTWRLEAIRECGGCHREQIHTYRDTFHGQVTSLGFVRTATCADCHGAHEIYPNEDPRSTVSGDRRVATCRTCHPNATARFAQYDPHADRHNRARNPALYYAGLVMDGLLATVLLFWGVHLVLWLRRGWALRGRAALVGDPRHPRHAPSAPARATGESARGHDAADRPSSEEDDA